MGAIETALSDALDDLERQLQGQKAAVERELAEVEAKRVELLSKRDSISRAQQRRLDFSPVFGRDYQCPSCWITKEDRSTMRPVASRSDDDFFECGVCGFELQIPSGM